MQLNKSWMRGVEGRSRHCGSSLDSLPQSLHRTPIVLPTRPSLRPVSCDLGQRAKKEREEKRKFFKLLQATATARSTPGRAVVHDSEATQTNKYKLCAEKGSYKACCEYANSQSCLWCVCSLQQSKKKCITSHSNLNKTFRL